MRLLLTVALSAACASCAAPQLPADQVARIYMQLTATQTTAVQDGVRRSLKDPGSAQFGAMRAGQNGKGTTVVCGFVNAKNSYGGYTGAKPFLGEFAGDRFLVVGMGGTDIETLSVTQVCEQSGLSLQGMI